jgi:predicted PurR-regulated permease PerM
MTVPETPEKSPPWGSSTKLVIGLTFVGIMAALLIRFQSLLGPLLLTFILTYLLHPLASWLSSKTRLSWRVSVNLIYVVFVILMLGIFTLIGLAVVQQLESLIGVVERFLQNLPDLILDWSSRVYNIGPYRIELSNYLSTANLETFSQELLSAVQPLLGRAGGLLSTVATGTVSLLGLGFFVILVSYFILADTGQVPDRLVDIELPGYDADIRRLGREFGRIWNAFLRGQVILFTFTFIIYTVLLSILGVRYTLGLALLAGFARFVPYVGAWANWIVLILVTLFQKGNYFGLEPLYYMILVLALALIIDQVLDNVVSPRIMGSALGVHPAAVLVAAIVAANLLGLVGVILAAPVLASLTLAGRYTIRKMFDHDPWPESEDERVSKEFPWAKWGKLVKSLVRLFRQRRRER